ncbi:MAG: DUF4065 domain-containing protein [Acutalibacteraceae bacterium]|nr:DUF4065 domain-containing protein [Acutalibacteraceae bacterium]
MADIFDIAQWFLSQDDMTHKKLQKLCYYAQAWHCALYDGKPFIKENFEAWVHGPVCRELYARYAGYGWLDIPRASNNDEVFTGDELDILNAVYGLYKKFDGDQLEALTHREAPWKNQRVGLQPYQSSTNVISIADMKDYYLLQYQNAQND